MRKDHIHCSVLMVSEENEPLWGMLLPGIKLVEDGHDVVYFVDNGSTHTNQPLNRYYKVDFSELEYDEQNDMYCIDIPKKHWRSIPGESEFEDCCIKFVPDKELKGKLFMDLMGLALTH